MVRYDHSMVDPRTLPIVLLPGLDGTEDLRRELLDKLSVRRPVQLIEYPIDRVLGYDKLVAYVIERAPRGPFIILGESYSGPIAIEIAAADRRVAGLVLAASFAQHPLPSQLAALVWALDLGWTPKRLIAAALLGSWSTPAIEARLKGALAKLPREIVQARVCDALRVDKRDQLRWVHCPLLYLHGRGDRLVRRKSVDEIIGARPDCQVHRLDAPHMLLTTHADAAAAVIDQFCSELEAAP